MKKQITFIILCLFCQLLPAQHKEPSRIILITLDGMRWQEVFTGADPQLISNTAFVHDTTGLKEKFWRPTPEERREALFPFLWDSIRTIGQIHGNRLLGSKVDLTNHMWFSYPGYNEILTGKADDERINSNDKVDNPNVTVLEVAQKSEAYKGRVAAFGSWDVFPYIVNESRSGVPVNAGFELANGKDLSDRELFLNELQSEVPSPWSSVRLDAFTHHFAVEYMKREHPKLLYISYGETDDFAHDGNYEAYLNSAHNTDNLIKALWDFTQKDPFYRDNTLFIISTDHGRGTKPVESWKSHGNKVEGAGQVWLIVFGANVNPLGEIRAEEQLYSVQIAPVIYEVLGLQNPLKNPFEPLSEIFTR